MDKDKASFAREVLSFVNMDLDKCTERQCRGIQQHLRDLGGKALNALLLPQKYSGGASGKSSGAVSSGKRKEFLEDLQSGLRIWLDGWITGRNDETLGDVDAKVRLNYYLAESPSPGAAVWSFTVTPEGESPAEKNPLLWRFLVGMAWVLDGLPINSIKRCVICKNLFIQTTKRQKDSCSHACAVRATDEKRKGTPKRIETQKKASDKQYAERLRQKLGQEVVPKQYSDKRRMWVRRYERRPE